MTHNPRVSVVMPARNAERFIGEAIESVLRQSFKGWELIIVNDASSDLTPDIARGYAKKDARIRVVESDTNVGVALAAKMAYDNSNGDYIAHLDADDLLAPEALAECAECLDMLTDVAMIYTNHDVIQEDGSNPRLGLRCTMHYSPENLLRCFMVFHLRVLRRSALDAVGGVDASMGLAWDYDLCLRVSELVSPRIYHLSQVLYSHRRHRRQITRSQRIPQIIASRTAVIRACERRGIAERPFVRIREEFVLESPLTGIDDLALFDKMAMS